MVGITKNCRQLDADLYWADVDEERVQRLPFVRGVENLAAVGAIPELSLVPPDSEVWVKIKSYRHQMLKSIFEHNKKISEAYNVGSGFPQDLDIEWVGSRGIDSNTFSELVEDIESATGLHNLDAKPFARCGSLIVKRLDYRYEEQIVLYPLELKSLFVSGEAMNAIRSALGWHHSCSVIHSNGELTGWHEIIPKRAKCSRDRHLLYREDMHFANFNDSDLLHVSEAAWELLTTFASVSLVRTEAKK